jgi:Domain of Unknown Function (DUF1080)
MKRTVFLAALIATVATVASAAAADPKAGPGPDGKWPRHSMDRPRPKVVAPQYDGAPVAAPADAVVLFDGKDLTKWKQQGKKDAPDDLPKWKVENGYAEVVRGTGTMATREPIKGDVHLHIEWATPAEVKGNSQGRGNSGVFIGGFPEVQVLDSWENDTYPDGQAAALYGQQPPLVNASKKPGDWQCYDITIERAKIEDGKMTQKARLTVKHNGVLVQDKVEFDNKAQEGILSFQDHGNPVRYRNIWYRPLK